MVCDGAPHKADLSNDLLLRDGKNKMDSSCPYWPC